NAEGLLDTFIHVCEAPLPVQSDKGFGDALEDVGDPNQLPLLRFGLQRGWAASSACAHSEKYPWASMATAAGRTGRSAEIRGTCPLLHPRPWQTTGALCTAWYETAASISAQYLNSLVLSL